MKKIILILVFMMSFFIGCIVIDFGCTVNFVNKSDHVVYVYFSNKDSLDRNEMFSLYDEIYLVDKDTIIYPPYRIEPDSAGSISFGGTRKKLVTTCCEDKMIRFFFIKESTLLEKTWNEIYEGQLYEKRLTFTQEDLEAMNFTVVYNP